jgi:hypothetical protein
MVENGDDISVAGTLFAELLNHSPLIFDFVRYDIRASEWVNDFPSKALIH